MSFNSRRWLIGAAATIVFILCVLAARRLRLDEDVTALLPDSDPVVADYRLLGTHLGALDMLYFDVGAASASASAPVAREQIVAVADALHQSMADSGLFQDIHYTIAQEQFPKLLEELSRRKANYLSAADAAAVEAALAPQEAQRRLRATWRALIEPSGSFLREHLRADPLGLDQVLLDKLRETGANDNGAEIVNGRIWSRDGQHLLIMALPRCAAMDTLHGTQLIDSIERWRSAAVGRAPAGAVRISYIGGHRAAVDNAATIKGDLARIGTATALGIALAGLLFFRRKIAILHMFLPALFGTAFAAGVFGLCYPLISPIATGCGGVLIGMAVDYGVQILFRRENTRVSPRQCMRSMVLPLAMASGTTIAAMLCLLFSSLPGQRQVGVFAAIGMVGSTIFAVLVLPYCLRIDPADARGRAAPLARALGEGYQRFLDWRARHWRRIAVVGALVLALSAWGALRLRFEGDVSKMAFMRPATLADQQRITAVWGDFSATLLAVRGNSLEEAMQANDRLALAVDGLKRQGTVRRAASIASILPSRKTQQDNWQRWQEFWSPARVAAVRAGLAATLADLHFAPGAFEPFYQSLHGPFAPIEMESFADTGLDKLLRSRIIHKGEQWFILSMLNPADDAALAASVIPALQRDAPGVVIVNQKRFIEHVTLLVKRELRTLTIASFLAVSACIYLLFLRVELTAASFVAIAVGLLLSVGVLGLLGISINLFNCFFVILLFGAGIDYSGYALIAELDAYRGYGEHQAVSFGATSLCFVVTISSFMGLGLAQHPALFSIGVAGVITMLASMVAAMFVVPPIARWLLPRDGRVAPSAGALVRRLFAGERQRPPNGTPAMSRHELCELYNYQGPYVENYVYWKLRLDGVHWQVAGCAPHEGVVLDGGCGYGLMSNLLAATSPARQVVGVDLDAGKLAAARSAARGLPNVRYEEANLLDHAFPACDCVLLMDVLHYWPEADQERIAAKAAACLRPGGTLVLRDGMAAPTLAHRLIVWSERLSTRLGVNHRGKGLYFKPMNYYRDLFEGLGLRFCQRHDWGAGSNAVLIFQRPAAGRPQCDAVGAAQRS